MWRATGLFLFSWLLLACAASPFKLDGVNQNLSPQLAKQDPKWQGSRVLWGGLIVETRNFQKGSQIEVLAYPLDADGEPIRSAQAQGRFLLNYESFLDPAQFNSGRWVSAVGTVAASVKGQVGAAEYTYPVLQAGELHLWPESYDRDTRTRFHFGIGIRL